MTTPEPTPREGLVLDLNENEYHGNGIWSHLRTAEFSSSAAKEMLKSAAHYDWTYNKGHGKSSKAMTIGTAVHTKVLGVGMPAIEVPERFITDSGKRSTAAPARLWEAEQQMAGFEVFMPDEMQQINAMAENLLLHPDVGPALEQEHHPEASMFGTCPRTGVRMRGRFDVLPTGTPFAIDVKTGRDASLKGFTRAIEDRGYDVQHGHYIELAGFAGVDWIEEMLFVVVESSPPYLVNTIRLDPNWREMGVARARSARESLARCQESGKWPGYPLGVKTASPPPWVINKYQDEITEELERLQ